MGKTLMTMLAVAACLCASALQTPKPQRLYTAQNDTIKQRNNSTTACTDRPIVMQDTLRLKLNRLKVDSKAVETKKFDTFNEKMKEPWLGDLLKDIIFH